MFRFFIYDSMGCAMICATEITIFGKLEQSLKWFYTHHQEELTDNYQIMPLRKIKEIHCDNLIHNQFLLKLLKTTVMGEYFKLSHDMDGDSVIVNIAYREDAE